MKTDNHFVNILMLLSVISTILVVVMYGLTSVAMGFLYQLIPFLIFLFSSLMELLMYVWEYKTGARLAPMWALFCSLLKIGAVGFYFFVIDVQNLDAIYMRLAGQATTAATWKDKILVFSLPLSPVLTLLSGLSLDLSLFTMRRENRS